jgi:hypothetical protein
MLPPAAAAAAQRRAGAPVTLLRLNKTTMLLFARFLLVLKSLVVAPAPVEYSETLCSGPLA